MMAKLQNIEVPYSKKTKTFLDYKDSFSEETVMLPNRQFSAVLLFKDFTRGRSATRFWFKDIKTGDNMSFSFKSADNILKHSCAGYISGTFKFEKRGANYQTVIVSINDPDEDFLKYLINELLI